MNKEITKINMNKVIVLIISFIALIFLTMIINTYAKYNNDNKKIDSNKNEYASNHSMVIDKKESTVKSDDVIEVNTTEVVESEPVIQEKNINTETISYFENTEQEIVTLVENEDKKFSTKVKEKFVELVDFIFYGTEINGVTFEQLTEETKQKLIDIVNRIDVKIEEKVPGYKETISNGAKESYTFLVDKLKKGVSYVDGKIEEKIGAEKYEEIKENLTDAKDKVKEGGSVVIEKGKEIFNNTKEKIKNWYEGWK